MQFDTGMNCTRNVAFVPAGSWGGFSLTVRIGRVGTAVLIAPGAALEPDDEALETGTPDPDGVAPVDPVTAGPRPGEARPVNMSVAAATSATTSQKPTNRSQNGTGRRSRRGLPCSSKSGELTAATPGGGAETDLAVVDRGGGTGTPATTEGGAVGQTIPRGAAAGGVAPTGSGTGP